MFPLSRLGARWLGSLGRSCVRGRGATSASAARCLRESRSVLPSWEPSASAAYHPATHYALGQAQPQAVRFGESTVLVYRVRVMWTADRDGRVRDLQDLNLSHLSARVIASQEEPNLGDWRQATLTLWGGPPRHRFLPKD